MSLKRVIKTDLAPEPVGTYSQATITGNFFYVSGQLGLSVPDLVLPETFAEQLTNALYNVKAVVEACSSSLDRVLHVTVYLTTMENFAEFDRIYSEFFRAQPPAREVVAVKELPRGALVEISVRGFVQDSL